MQFEPFPEFGFEQNYARNMFKVEKRSVYDWSGGEDEGLKRLEAYMKDVAKYPANTKNRSEAIKTSKLSPYIASGCLSVRKVYHSLKAYEKEKA
jgi:deoxyribodipyrimidine photo-lyase